jgi:hypothetical protein
MREAFSSTGTADLVLFYPWIRDSRWEKIRIREKYPGSYFPELSDFPGFKILKILFC